MPNIDSITMTPSTVFCGHQFVISVVVTDPLTWLLESSDAFLIDSNDEFLVSDE